MFLFVLWHRRHTVVNIKLCVNLKGLLLKCYFLFLLPHITFQVAKVLKHG